MTSHQLAHKLLALPDKEITVCKPVEGGSPYVAEYEVAGSPWEDALDHIRIQVKSAAVQAAVKKTEQLNPDPLW